MKIVSPKKEVLLLIIFYFLKTMKFQCISSILYPCISCSSNFYEKEIVSINQETQNFSNKDCYIKNFNSSNILLKILVLNSECNNCNIVNYNFTFYQLELALQQIHEYSIINFSGSIEFYLQKGTHYLLRKNLKNSDPEFFRKSLFEFKFKTLNNEKVTIKIKTNEFFFFISNIFTIENIIFEGLEISFQISNDDLSCYNLNETSCCQNNENCNHKFNDLSANKQNYGFFNLEKLLDNSIVPHLKLFNCSFINFINVFIDKGFSTIFILSPIISYLTLENISFENNFSPKGIILIENNFFYNVLTLNEIKKLKENENSKIFLKNIGIKNYNQKEFNFKNLENNALFKINNFMGEIFIEQIMLENIKKTKYIFYVMNSPFFKLHINNSAFNYLKESSILQIDVGFELIFDGLIIKNNNTIIFDFLFELKNIATIILKNTIILDFQNEKTDMFYIFSSKLLILNSLFQNSIVYTFFKTVDSTFNINNSTFNNIKFKKYLINGMNSLIFSVKNSYFTKNEGDSSLIYLTAIDLVEFYNTTFFRISSLFVLDFDYIIENKNNFLILIENKANYFWLNDPKINYISINSSLILRNFFVTALFSNFGVSINFILFDTYIKENNSTGFALFNVFYTKLTLINMVLIKNYLISDKLSDSVMSVQDKCTLYVENSYFENNGIPFLKIYYVALTHNAFFGFYDVKIAKFINNKFILTGLINQISGILNGLPLGNELFLEQNKFILINPNDKYEYKGLMIQATPRVIFKKNFFFGLKCNKRSFQHIHGAILFESDLPSYKYQKNSYTIELDGDKYINCNCWKGGTISILGIKEIKIKNCLFLNSTSEDFAGHMSVIGGEFNTFINNTFQYSRAKDGGCLLFWSIAQVIMSENKIYNSNALGNGNIFIKEVIEFILNLTIFDNIFTSSNGGCLYLFQSNAFVHNVTINNSQAIGKGGSFYLESFSSLKLFNSTIINNIANEGGCLYINNANTLLLNNIYSFNNTSEKKGGFIYSSLIEIFILQNINIIKNYCNQVGIIFISCEKEYSIFNISNIICLKNKANEGSCIYYIAISKLFLNNITCIENYENVLSFYWPFEINIYLNLIIIKDSFSLSNFITFSGVKIELVNLKIYQCISEKYLIDSSESKLFIKYSNICNVSSLYLIHSIMSELNFNDIILTNTLNKSTSLLDSINSKIECKNITVTNSSFRFVIKMIYGNLIIENSLFLNNNFCLISLSLVNANISFSTFNNVNKNSLSLMPNDLLFEESLVDSYNILIFSCLFNVFNYYSIELKGKIYFILKNSSFLSNNIYQTSAILFYNLLNIFIMDNYFLNFTNSAIQIISTNKISNQAFDFIQNSYINNRGECGGSINAKGDFSLNFNNNTFENNMANLFNSSKKCSGVGGSIFFIGLDSDNNFLNLTKNKFENNFADLQGPNSFSTIKTFNNENSFINCSDQNNFTNQLFSYPIQLNLYNKNKVISFKSGNKFELNLILTDYFHQKLIFDKSTIFIIKNLENPKLKILITNPIGEINSGNIIFKDLIINSLSDELFNLTIEGNFAYIGQTTLISLKIEFYSEKCTIGSIIKSDLTCYMCPQDFYSFILPTNKNSGVLSCINCPSNSYCYGSNLVFPIEGYYRKNNITIDPVECINIEACEGGLYNSNELINLNYEYSFFGNCKEGNFGNLCYNCLEGYGKFEEKDACLKCGDNNLMIYFRLVGILMFISFYLIIGSRFEEDLNKNKITSERLRVIIRAIISHNQQIIIIFSDINIFPIFSLKRYFNVLESITFLNENAVNNDCIIFSSFTVESIFILKKVLILLIPFFCSFLTLFVHYTVLFSYNYFVKKENKIFINLQDILLNLEFFCLFSVFLFYPLMLKSSFDFLNCMKLDKNENEYYLRINPNIQCFQSKYNKLFFFIGFPGIIVYGIGYPLLLYFSLKKIYKTKSNLISKESQAVNKSVARKFSEFEIKRSSQILSKSSEKSTNPFSFSSKRVFTIRIQDNSIIQSQKIKRLSKFSFFHKDMNGEYFYWQSIILMRKFFLTFISTLNEIISQEMRYFFIVIICLIFIFPMVKFNPFKFKNENSIEIISLSICIFAALCCLVLNSNSDDIFKLIISLFFFIFNIIFMAYLGYILANLLKDFCKKNKITKMIRKSQKPKLVMQNYKIKFKS